MDSRRISVAILVLFTIQLTVTANGPLTMDLDTIIGIDLGTTYSSVGVYRPGVGVEIITNDQGNRKTPSWVAFTDTGRLIGEAAREQGASNAHRTIFDVKRLIGRKFEEGVQKEMKRLPYKVINKEGKAYVEVRGDDGEAKAYSPEQITAMFLSKMKDIAETYLGHNVTQAIVTIPCYFNDAQRQATMEAGKIAGLEILQMISEPTAAAIAYDLHKEGLEKNILVYDIGGATFDVTIIRFTDVYEVLSSNGNALLGGNDFDHRLMDYFTNIIHNKYNKDITNDHNALWKLQRECERAKITLSSHDRATVEIESLFDGVNFFEPLTRTMLEEVNKDLFGETMGVVVRALEEAGVKKTDVEEIVVVGGSSRIPKIREIWRVWIPRRPWLMALRLRAGSSVK